jgi:primary-amine oxidase
MREGYELLKDSSVHGSGSSQKTNVRRRLLYTVLAIVGVFACSSLYALSPRVHIIISGDQTASAEASLDSKYTGPSPKPLEQCAASLPLPAKPPAPVNLWASLSVGETVSIHEWLTHPSRGLNLTAADKASLDDNLIYHIEVYRPAKSDALAYLDAPAESRLPIRYSRVSIHLGARPLAQGGPVVKDYLVGPLPIGDETTLKELTEIYHREDIPFNARGFGDTPFGDLPYLLTTYMPRLADVTKARFQI